jgi:uncharacterized Zn-finger protein
MPLPLEVPFTGPLPAKQARDGRRYPCPLPGCGSAFKTRHGLVRHWRSHTGEKRFPCPHPACGKAFAHRPGLNYHLAAEHTGERAHRCDVPGCGAAFPGASALKVHVQKHHSRRAGDKSKRRPVGPGPALGVASSLASRAWDHDGGGGGHGGGSGSGGPGAGGRVGRWHSGPSSVGQAYPGHATQHFQEDDSVDHDAGVPVGTVTTTVGDSQPSVSI